jgi:hypothetical protein
MEKRPPAIDGIGEAWGGIRGVLDQAYSTKMIKEILGKA